jgi:hypothetical protein
MYPVSTDAGDLPVGRFREIRLRLLSSPALKNISVFPKCKSGVYLVPSRTPQEGRCASSRRWVQEAMDASDVGDDRHRSADGKIVWS